MYAICFAWRFWSRLKTRERERGRGGVSEQGRSCNCEGDRLISMSAFQHGNKSKIRFQPLNIQTALVSYCPRPVYRWLPLLLWLPLRCNLGAELPTSCSKLATSSLSSPAVVKVKAITDTLSVAVAVSVPAAVSASVSAAVSVSVSLAMHLYLQLWLLAPQDIIIDRRARTFNDIDEKNQKLFLIFPLSPFLSLSLIAIINSFRLKIVFCIICSRLLCIKITARDRNRREFMSELLTTHAADIPTVYTKNIYSIY